MKKFAFIALILFLLIPAFAWYIVTTPVCIKSAQESFEASNEDSLRAHVEFLCNTPEFRNFRNLESLNLAAEYIFNVFSQYADSVYYQEFEVAGTTYRNVVATIEAGTEPCMVIGAHYDVCNNQAGADDNASGVAGLLELCRILSENRESLKRTYELVAFTLEEPPYFRTSDMGSAHHARYCRRNKIEIELMVCLEMIGYFTDDENSQAYPQDGLELIYPSVGNYIALVGEIGHESYIRRIKSLMKVSSDLPVESISAPASMPGIDFSDHLNYWSQDYRAIMVTNTSFYRNRNYHEPTDTPETLDFQRMNKVVNGVAYALIHYDDRE